MHHQPAAPAADLVPSPRRPRRRRVRVALAALAVLGLGFVATSAGWTDQVWFGGGVGVSRFALQGSVHQPGTDGAVWRDGRDDELVFDAPLELGPGTTVQSLWVRNDDSTNPAQLDAVVTVSSEVDEVAEYLRTRWEWVGGDADPVVLDPDEYVELRVSFVLGEVDGDGQALPDELRGAALRVTILVTGSEVVPA